MRGVVEVMEGRLCHASFEAAIAKEASQVLQVCAVSQMMKATGGALSHAAACLCHIFRMASTTRRDTKPLMDLGSDLPRIVGFDREAEAMAARQDYNGN